MDLEIKDEFERMWCMINKLTNEVYELSEWVSELEEKIRILELEKKVG